MLEKILKQYFGFDQFRPLQKEAIEAVLNQKDVLVVLPTGEGKSLIYQIPAIVKDGVVLVFSPLISLMKDQVDQLAKLGISAAFINSTMTPQQKNAVYEKVQAQKIKILYVAPEGFFTGSFQRFLGSANISLIAIDESHCISEWGHDFRPTYRQLSVLRSFFPQVPIVALTATATRPVQHDIIKQLDSPAMIPLIGSFERQNLSLMAERKTDIVRQITKILRDRAGESGIIYCSTRKKVDELSDLLEHLGFDNLPYHAGMEKEARRANQEAYLNDQVQLMVATVAFGMGINKSNIRFIIHANLPSSIEAYYQQVGRAGRDGLPSDCFLFHSAGDIATQRYFIDQIENSEYQKIASQKLESMIQFTGQNLCRHAVILDYFGQVRPDFACQERCDVCLRQDIGQVDITKKARTILSGVAGMPYPVGINVVTGVLAGSKSKKVAKFNHVAEFGALRSMRHEDIRELIMSLIDLGLIQQETGQYPVLILTSGARKVIAGKQNVVVSVSQVQSTDEIIDFEAELMAQLKDWRYAQAQTESVPPYIIFSDKVLQDLARYLPQNSDHLQRISGIGAMRLERYGQDLLKIITKYCERKDLGSKMDAMPTAPGKKSSGYVRNSETLALTLALYEQGSSIDDIAKQRQITSRTVVGHLEELLRAGKIPANHLKKLVEPERRKIISQVLASVGHDGLLRQVKERLGDDFSYDEIRLVRAVEFSSAPDRAALDR